MSYTPTIADFSMTCPRAIFKAMVSLTLLLCPISGFSQAPEKVAIQFHWLQQFEFAGFYVAREKGLYTDVGLDVEFLPHHVGTTNVVDSVVSGRAQYGVNYSSLLHDYHQKKPVVALAALLQDSPLVLMTRDDPGIESPEDLKSRRIMIGGDALNSAPIMALLFRHELLRSDIVKQEHSHDVRDLIDGKTDAMTAYISNEPYQMQELGQAYRIFDPKDFELSFYENLLFTSANELENHPERLQAFVQASLDGWIYAFQHIEETARLIHEKYNEQGKSLKSLIYEGHELRKLAFKDGVPFGNIDFQRLDKIEDAYHLMGIDLSKKTLDDFIWQGRAREGEKRLSLTPREQYFIRYTDINVATTTGWEPISFVDEKSGQTAGIGYDFWQEIVKVTGLKASITGFDSFSEELDSLRNKKQDVIYSVGITEERKKYALFTEPYARFPIAITTSKEEHFIQDVEQLRGRKIAVGRNFTAHRMMSSAYPDLDYVLVDNVRAGLQLVSTGSAYAYVDIMPTMVHSINRYGYTNLKISGNTGLNFDLRIMIRDDYPELVSIANKVISTLHPDTRQEILNKWINVQYQQVFSFSQYWHYAAIVLLAISVLLLWMQKTKIAAQSANRAKSEFLASMSHEIRTPMTGVIGYADMLLDDELPAESEEKVLRIKSSTASLLRLLNDILDMSKLEAGKMEIENIDFNLPELIAEVIDQAQKSRLFDQQIVIDTRFSNDFPTAANSDPTRIRQILVNLIGNAVKFTHEGSIAVNGELVRNKRGGEVVRISIHDTGIGMNAETIKILFAKFTQADASISRRYEGSGLGLAICRRLVNLLHGEIGAESQEGVGSLFWFTFPYIAATTEPMSKDERLKPQRYRARRPLDILLAEDNPANQYVIKKFLAPLGHRVTTVENGSEAVASLEQNEYDLILMDIRMPEMDGTDATRLIRQLPGAKASTPIIAVTADAMKEHIDEYIAAGINLWVAKPIDREELVNAINQALGEEVHLSEAS